MRHTVGDLLAQRLPVEAFNKRHNATSNKDNIVFNTMLSHIKVFVNRFRDFIFSRCAGCSDVERFSVRQNFDIAVAAGP